MKYTIIALGRLGQKIYHLLGDHVTGSFCHTSKHLAKEYFYDFAKNDIPSQVLEADTIILNLPPSSIGSLEHVKRFTSQLHNKKIVFVSSTSVYGQAGEVDENVTPEPQTENGKLLLLCENYLLENLDTLIVRPAGLFDESSHPAQYISKKGVIDQGQLPVNLIHRDEVANIIVQALRVNDKKIINAVNTHHPLKGEYYANYCKENQLAIPKINLGHEKGKVVKTVHSECVIHSELP